VKGICSLAVILGLKNKIPRTNKNSFFIMMQIFKLKFICKDTKKNNYQQEILKDKV